MTFDCLHTKLQIISDKAIAIAKGHQQQDITFLLAKTPFPFLRHLC